MKRAFLTYVIICKMANEKDKYFQLREAFTDFLKYVGNHLTNSCKISPENITLNLEISDEIFIKTLQSIDEYSRCEGGTYKLSPVKSTAILCFWIKKLKPYSVKDISYNPAFFLKINETCAVLAAKIILWHWDKSLLDYNTKHFQSLLANLRYESTSISSLIALFQAKTGKI